MNLIMSNCVSPQVASTDIEEGMRVGVDRNKYQIHIPLPPKIDPTVTMMQVSVARWQKFDPFLSLDCARVEGMGAQSKERKGSNFAIWKPSQTLRCL